MAQCAQPSKTSSDQSILDRRHFLGLAGLTLISCQGGGGGSSNALIADANAAETAASTLYVVTDWGAVAGDVTNDLAQAFNNIFADIDSKGLDGAAIYIPPGTFYLSSIVTIRHDHLTIYGANHGFSSGTGNGGGSRVIVRASIGFYAPVSGASRINGLVFEHFMLDGEAVANGRRGIYVARDNDTLVVQNMTFKEFDQALVIRNADAALIQGNRILENNSCLRLENTGKAVVVANNLLGGKPSDITVFCEGQERMVFSGNNVFPDGYSNLVMKNCTHCSVSGNQLQSYYTGMIYLEGASNYNNISSNSLVSEMNPANNLWNVNASHTFADDFGVIRIEGDHNLIAANSVYSAGGAAHIMLMVSGANNQIQGSKFSADQTLPGKITVSTGSVGNENSVLDSVASNEVNFTSGISVIFRELPVASTV